MFDSIRRKTVGNNRPAKILRDTPETAHTMNHWAWTGWMPEAERSLAQPAVQSIEHHTPLLAA